MAALAEMYVQGVSTRKVKAITEELCGHRFSASSISAINKRLDASLAQFAGRRLEEAYPYLIPDARYERVREAGVIRSQAVLVAVAVGWDGRRSVLGVEIANRESRSSWRGFLLGLKGRGLPFAGSCPRPLRGSDRASADARWGRVHGGRRPCRAQGGAARGPGGGSLPALLRALSAQRPRLCAAPVSSADIPPGDRAQPDGRRRLPAGSNDGVVRPLALRPARSRRSEAGSRGLAGEVAGQVPEADQPRGHGGDGSRTTSKRR